VKVSLFTVIVSILASQTGCKNLFPPAEPPGPPWVVFTTRNSPLAGDKVNAIAEDAEGNIWFGTDSGASAFTGKSWMSVRDQLTFLVYDNNSVAHPTKTVTSIVLDKKRNVWFGLLGGGAERYNPVGSGAVWTRYLITDGYVYGIAANLYDPGDVFFATSWGISRFTPSSTDPTIGEWGSITTDDIPELATNRMSFTVANANDNTVWFGTQKGTVIRTWYDEHRPDHGRCFRREEQSVDRDDPGRVVSGLQARYMDRVQRLYDARRHAAQPGQRARGRPQTGPDVVRDRRRACRSRGRCLEGLHAERRSTAG